jgi:Protein of unknown function (DUF3037)
VPVLHTYDYAVVRVVPRVERGEFINAGIIVYCGSANLLSARIELDEQRLLALEPDVDLVAIIAALSAIPAICVGGASAGPIGLLAPRERFDWLVADRSTSIQTSPVHSGRCVDPNANMEQLLSTMVRRPATGADTTGRRLK